MSIDSEATPGISVVIPCYNSARLISESVASITNQTVPVTEVILVDDASSDNTVEVLKEIRSRHSNVEFTILENATNLGPGKSRNRGIQAAKGQYVAFLDSDDLWLHDKLELQLEFMRSANCEATVGEVVITDELLRPFDAQNKSAFESMPDQELARAIFLGRVTMSTPTLIAERKVLLEHGGFDEHLRLREDHALLIRLSLAGKLRVMARPVVKRRAHSGSYSSGVSPLHKYRHELRFIRTFRKEFDAETVRRARESLYRTMIDHCFLTGSKRWALRFIKQYRAGNALGPKAAVRYTLLTILPAGIPNMLLMLRRRLKVFTGKSRFDV